MVCDRTCGCNKRRRKVQTGDEKAAAVIQRATRRYLSIKNTFDLITLEQIPKEKRFLLVENTEGIVGVAYKFNGPILSAHFLCSGDFTHPILRRPILGVEITRMCRSTCISARDAHTLRVAFEFRENVARWKIEEQSILSFLESDIAVAFQDALRIGELELLGAEGINITGATSSYDEALDRLLYRHPAALGVLVAQHLALIEKRNDIGAETRLDLEIAMDDAARESRRSIRKSRRDLSSTALGDWIQSWRSYSS
jgi:hypothetical protein